MDNAWYSLPNTVTIVGVKGRAGEKIDLRTSGLPPCNAQVLNPPNPKTLQKRDAVIKARVVVHFHRYFNVEPLQLEHTIRVDGTGGATQHAHVLHDPERKGVPRRVQSSPGYLHVVALVSKVQRRWRALSASRVLRPRREWSSADRHAASVQAGARGARSRAEAREERRAARDLGLETWSTLHPTRSAQPATGLAESDEFLETKQEADARRSRHAQSREGQLQQRALQRERDRVSKVVVRPSEQTRAAKEAMVEQAIQASPGLLESFAQGGRDGLGGPSVRPRRAGGGVGGRHSADEALRSAEAERVLASQRIQAHARRRRAALQTGQLRERASTQRTAVGGVLLGDGLLGDEALAHAALVRGQVRDRRCHGWPAMPRPWPARPWPADALMPR